LAAFHFARNCERDDGLLDVRVRPVLWFRLRLGLWTVYVWTQLLLSFGRLRIWVLERLRLSAVDVWRWIVRRETLLLAVRLVLCAGVWRSLRRFVRPGLFFALCSDVRFLLRLGVRRRALRLHAVLRQCMRQPLWWSRVWSGLRSLLFVAVLRRSVRK
jgi:hypothetical protein